MKSLGHRGYGFIEIMIATGILMTVVLGTGTVFNNYMKSRLKVEAVLLASGIELDLALQIANPLSKPYTDDPVIQAELLSGGDINIIKNIEFPLAVETGFVNIKADGIAQFIRADGSVCANFDDPNCIISIVLNVQKIGNRHAFSYEIHINDKRGSIQAFGDVTKFTSYIPTDLYKPVVIQECDFGSPAKSPPGDIGVRGINRSTGQVYCISKPLSGCPVGSLPTGTKFVDDFIEAGTSGGRLEMNCAPVPKPSVSCPNDFVLSSFNATGAGASGSCVFKLESPAKWPKTYEANSIEFTRACPKDYIVQPDCQLTINMDGQDALCPGGSSGWPGQGCDGPFPGGCNTYQDPPDPLPDPPPAPVCLAYDPDYCTKHQGCPTYAGGVVLPSIPPVVKQTLNASKDGFKCSVDYQDQPGYYDRFICDGDTAKTWCTTRALSASAKMTVGFSCIYNQPDKTAAF